MEVVIAVIYLVFGVLGLILFFKIWGMTNDVKELKETLLFEIQKNNVTIESHDSSMKKETEKLAELVKQDEKSFTPQEALEHQFKVAVKKYKVQCITNSVADDKYQAGVQSMIGAYQKKAKEEGFNIDFASMID